MRRNRSAVHVPGAPMMSDEMLGHPVPQPSRRRLALFAATQPVPRSTTTLTVTGVWPVPGATYECCWLVPPIPAGMPVVDRRGCRSSRGCWDPTASRRGRRGRRW